jgi:hypothetical protein
LIDNPIPGLTNKSTPSLISPSEPSLIRERRLERVRIYLIEKLSFFYKKAIVVVLREQVALNPWRDLANFPAQK